MDISRSKVCNHYKKITYSSGPFVGVNDVLASI